MHGCSRDVWKMLTPPESWLTCCWILIRALWSDNGHFCQTGQNSKQHHHRYCDQLGVQPWGREGRLSCSTLCSSCNWSCSWDLYLGSVHRFPPKGSLLTRVCSRVLPAVSIILIGQLSLPPTLVSSSFCCILFFSSDPGVGGTKMQDFQKGPNQLFFFFLFSSHREDFLHSFCLYIGLKPCLSAATILL